MRPPMNSLKCACLAAAAVAVLVAGGFAQDTGGSTDRSTTKPTTGTGHHQAAFRVGHPALG